MAYASSIRLMDTFLNRRDCGLVMAFMKNSRLFTVLCSENTKRPRHIKVHYTESTVYMPLIALAAIGTGGCDSRLPVKTGDQELRLERFVPSNGTTAEATNIKGRDSKSLRISSKLQGFHSAATGSFELKVNSIQGHNIEITCDILREDDVPVPSSLSIAFIDSRDWDIDRGGVLSQKGIYADTHRETHRLQLSAEIPERADTLKVFIGTDPIRETSEWDGEVVSLVLFGCRINVLDQ